MSFFTNNKSGKLYFVTGYGTDYTNEREGTSVVSYYPCDNPSALCFRELSEFNEKFSPDYRVQSEQSDPAPKVSELPYPLRLCVEMVQYAAVSNDLAKEMRPSEVKEHLSHFFDEYYIDQAEKILTGRSELFKG